MPPQTSSYHLFGLDLRLLWNEFCAAWEPLLQSRYLAWLAPALPVRLLRADGSDARWWRDRIATSKQANVLAEFEAVELPEDLLLRKRLQMPELPPSDIAQAVELEVQAISPFASGDAVWGYQTDSKDVSNGSIEVEIVVTSRKHASHYVGSQQHRLSKNANGEPEVWALSRQGYPIILRGWGERRRQARAQKNRRAAYVLIASALLLVGIISISPSLQLRSRSLEAIAAYEELQRETAKAASRREDFTRSVERLGALRDVLAEHVDLLRLLATLTKVLPDDTYLQSVQLQGLKLTLHGLTADSAALMQMLSSVPGFKEVRAPQAATRMAGASAENFRVEIQLEASAFTSGGNTAGPLPMPEPNLLAPSANKGANAASAVASAPGAPVSAASTPLPPISGASASAGSPAPRKSRFTSGG